MDKLTLAGQQKVRKMSDERIRAKLIEAGYEKNDIDLTEREELLALYAEFFIQTQTRVSVSEPPAPAKGDDYPPPGWTVGHTDLDREALEFEKRKWEVGQKYREFEMGKWKEELRLKEAEEKHKEFER